MISEGSDVSWSHGLNRAKGKVKKVFLNEAEIEINGEKIKREASSESPAYLIELEDGRQILKSAGEIHITH